MPNHCANVLRVTGKQDLLDEFQEFAKGFGPNWDGKKKVDYERETPPVELDINKFVPVPKEFLKGKDGKDAFNSGGYEWVVANQGTKWGCYDITVTKTKGQLQYRYQTAWSPFANNVLEAMAERFPELKFEMKYAEQGVGFCGIVLAEGGEVVEDNYYEGKQFVSKLSRDSELQELADQSG